MPGVISDIIRGAAFSYDLKGGTRIVKYFITGLTPAPDGDPPVEAAFVSGVPQIYTPYPFFSTNMYCVDMKFDPYPDKSKTSIMATAKFSSPTVDLTSGYQIRINGTILNKVLSNDPRTITPGNPIGNPFRMNYQDPDTKLFIGPQFYTVPGYVPHATLEFERIEPQAPVDAAAYGQICTGKLNQDPFQGWPPNYWMYKPPSAELLNQNAYRVTRSFELAPESWVNYRFWHTANNPNGQTPNDVQIDPLQQANINNPNFVPRFGVGVYIPPSIAFASLNLPKVFT